MASTRKTPGHGLTAAAGLALLTVLLLVGLTIQLLASTSIYRDTGFQIQISQEGSFPAAVDRMASDVHAPGAQVVFWAAARLGLESIPEQRAISIVLSSTGYAAALLMGFRWRRSRESALPDAGSILILATALVVLSPGVFPVSAMVRYSSLTGPIWLAVFILTTRMIRGEQRLAAGLGALLGWGILVSYLVAVPLGLALIALAGSKSTRRRNVFVPLAKGLLPGLVATGAWLAYAGSKHLLNLVDRSQRARGTTPRSVAGHLYELIVWPFTGPSSLPTTVGVAVIVLVGLLVSFALTRPPVIAGLPLGAVVLFVVVPIPVFLLFAIDTGWSMAGPTAVLATAIALTAANHDRRGWNAGFALVLVFGAVAALPAAGVAVLRPGTYMSATDEAVERAAALTAAAAVTYAVDDWDVELLAGKLATAQAVILLRDRQLPVARDALAPTVVLILTDPVFSTLRKQAHDAARMRLDDLGYQFRSRHIEGRYDHLSLRVRLGLVEFAGQFTVEVWTAPPP